MAGCLCMEDKSVRISFSILCGRSDTEASAYFEWKAWTPISNARLAVNGLKQRYCLIQICRWSFALWVVVFSGGACISATSPAAIAFKMNSWENSPLSWKMSCSKLITGESKITFQEPPRDRHHRKPSWPACRGQMVRYNTPKGSAL